MTFFQAIFLAIVQGITEFLPISSSGHLIIFQKFFGFQTPVLFDILVHLGTLGSILLYFRRQLLKISWHFLVMVAVGTVPAVIVGLFLQKHIEQIFSSIKLVGISFLITAAFLLSTRLIRKTKSSFKYLKWPDAIFVGIFQAIAILPGVSRSGSTMVAGLWRGIDRQSVFQFSFFLAIPAILGAFVLQIPDLTEGHFNYLNQSLLGMLVAGIVGYFSLRVLESLLKSAKIFYFGFYCLILGLLALLI